VIGVFLFLVSGAGAEETLPFKDQKEKISYGIGVGVARDFKLRGVVIDVDAFLKGLKDELSGVKLLMTEQELVSTMDAYERELKLKQEQVEKAMVEENRKNGEAFLAENARKEGVVTLPSGLQYKVLKAGDGKKPTDADEVLINYRGTLINGTEFDSSYHTDQPAVFKIKEVIPGLREALKLMPSGSTWQIFIPSQLGYGDQRVHEVGPNSMLMFEVELLSVVKRVDSEETPRSKASGGLGEQSQPSGPRTSTDILSNPEKPN
jgi:FKBP-type peptidyl-prolyl cis-trans isomerase FklB